MSTTNITIEAGSVLNGKYRLDREIGAGGMGQVFAAWSLALEAPVAIKVLHPTSKPRSDLTKRFMQEARAAAQVRHANIVSVLDIGEDEASGSLFIVQEFLQGSDLKSHIAKVGVMAAPDALALLLPVMRALSYAHSKGVVHRDLKPDNIFLCDTPEGVVPKVIDFGIAKMLDEHGENGHLTKTSQVVGTPYYMCPEQAAGDRSIDHRADIWSLGVVLYHMVTGRFPYEGASTNLIITNIIARAPTHITEYAPNLSPDLVALVQGALAYQPEKRFATMEAFWHAARSCHLALGGTTDPAAQIETPRLSIATPPKAPAPQVTAPTVAPQIIASTPGATTAQSRSHVRVALAVLVLLSGLGSYLFSRKDRDHSTRHAYSRVQAQAPRVLATPAPTLAPSAPVEIAAPSSPREVTPVNAVATAPAPRLAANRDGGTEPPGRRNNRPRQTPRGAAPTVAPTTPLPPAIGTNGIAVVQ